LEIQMNKFFMTIGLLSAAILTIHAAQSASLVGVGSLAGAGVIGGTNSQSLTLSGAAIRTGSQVTIGPNGAAGQSATLAGAAGANASTPNASGGFIAGAIGGSAAGGFNSGNALSGPINLGGFPVPQTNLLGSGNLPNVGTLPRGGHDD
jgi:hypothetical protein